MTKNVLVQAITVTLEVSPAPPWIPGQTVNLNATVKIDGSLYQNQTVDFYVLEKNTMIASAVSGSDGVAKGTWAIPFADYPCNTWTIRATHRSSGVVSNTVSVQIAFNTRISIDSPSPVGVNVPFTVSGVLEYESFTNTWSPLSGRTVKVFYNGNVLGTVTTAADGSYSLTIQISASGLFTLKASYAGEGFTSALAESKISVELEVPPIPLWKVGLVLLAVAGAGVGVYVVTKE
jgi:hypothetical protein